MMSPTIGALAAALAKAQGVFEPAIKDAANPFFKSNYCDLAGAIKAARDALASNGLAVVQSTSVVGAETFVLESFLLHSSGEFISASYPVRPVKNDPQGMGSALTYARRYSFMALVGLAPEDDDGEAAQGRTAPSKVSGYVVRKAAGMPEARDEAGIAQDVEDVFGPDDPPADGAVELINEGQQRLAKAMIARLKIPLKRAKEIVQEFAGGSENLYDVPRAQVEAFMNRLEGAAPKAEAQE